MTENHLSCKPDLDLDKNWKYTRINGVINFLTEVKETESNRSGNKSPKIDTDQFDLDTQDISLKSKDEEDKSDIIDLNQVYKGKDGINRVIFHRRDSTIQTSK